MAVCYAQVKHTWCTDHASAPQCAQDNVALIAVLEALEPGVEIKSTDSSSRRQLICIANTHIHANPELNDVKLWQVYSSALENYYSCRQSRGFEIVSAALLFE